MGYSTLIDILGSTIIGAVLLMILLRMEDSATQNTFSFAGELQVQQNLVSVVQLVEYDFRKIGYCANFKNIPNPAASIIQADSTGIKFLTDIATSSNPAGDGNVDTLRYFLGNTSQLSSTPNPRDRMLYRVVNSGPAVGSNIGITEFKITYFDVFGAQIPYPITDTGEIYSMQIDVKVENTAAYNAQYSNAFWRQIRLAARNLRNR